MIEITSPVPEPPAASSHPSKPVGQSARSARSPCRHLRITNQPTPWQFYNAIEAWVPVRVTTTGFVDFAPNPAFQTEQCWAGEPAPPPPGELWRVGPFGYDAAGRPWQVVVRKDSSGLQLAPSPPNPTVGTHVAFAQGPGVINVGRPQPLYGGCQAASMYMVSGAQTVTIEQLEEPRAVPDKDRVPPGDTVRFEVQVSWSTNFTVESNWRWVSDTTTNTSTVVGNCAKQKECSVVVRERGHVEVDWVRIENGAINLQAKSPTIEVGPTAVRIRAVTGAFQVRPAGTGGTTTLELEVSVVSTTDGSPLPDRTVDLTLDGLEGTGGHQQHAGTMPPGSLSQSTVPTGPSGVATVVYSADVFGGDVEVRGTSGDAIPALETITVRVENLELLPSGEKVQKIGITTEHPSSHWGTPAMVSALAALADAFHAEYTRRLPVNDISLTFGGKFDVAPEPINYNRAGDHQWHRIGRNADVRTSGGGADSLTTVQREFVRRWWRSEQKGRVFEHTGSNPHYHLSL